MATWRFVHFLVNGIQMAGPSLTITVMGATAIEAVWEEIAPTRTLTITSALGGSTSPAPGSYSIVEGSLITVSAQPQADYQFDSWMLDGALNLANPITLLMDVNHVLQPMFSPLAGEYFTLTISASGPGTTNPTPGSYNLTPGSAITVTAFPAQGENQFDGWTLDGANVTVNPITVIMDADHALSATFSEVPQDTLQQTIGDYQIWLSAATAKYYIVGANADPSVTFPFLQDAIEYIWDVLIPAIQANWVPIALGLTGGGIFLAWLFTRKK